MENKNNKYSPKSLSGKEIELLTRLEYEGKEIYNRREIISFCKDKKEAKYLIKKLLEKSRLKKIIKNCYFFVPMKAPKGQWHPNEYLVAKALARKSKYYIGYSTVFSSYGFTDQIAQIIHIINDKYSEQKRIFGVMYKLKKVLPNRLYGFEKRKIKNEEVNFPKKERALIDLFEFYDVRRAYKILQKQLKNLDISLLVDYLSRYPTQSIRRRIGYILGELGVNENLDRVDPGVKGYTPLYDTGSKKGKIDKRWRIIING